MRKLFTGSDSFQADLDELRSLQLLEDHELDGKVGKIYNSLLSKWSENVHIDIKEQIKSWNSSEQKTKNSSPSPYKF